ncbi:MAG TPA: hypothetical protein VKU93_08100, partial [Terracidiphilus sp.]|nr:hypothetical protein [Terracidiphilus sp.]
MSCRPLLLLTAVSAVLFSPALALSQASAAAPDTQARIAALEQALKANQAATAAAQSAGDNAWML